MEKAGNIYRFDQLSDGQRALITLHLLLFADDAERTLFLDEPDNYITLPELQPWLAELEDSCGDTLPQTILISHHPEAIDFLSDNAIWLGREPESHTRILDCQKRYDAKNIRTLCPGASYHDIKPQAISLSICEDKEHESFIRQISQGAL